MSRTVVAIDVETTGLRPYDRIVTLAAVCTIEGLSGFELLHRCFDPRKDSDPAAYAIHGWDDWSTRFQDLWKDQAVELHAWLQRADVIVAHNAEFDLHYVNREFRKADLPPLQGVTFCTQQAARTAGRGSATLDACCARIGLRRNGDRHHAAEDAFLALNLYRHHHGQPLLTITQPWGMPTNYRQPPPRPEGELPRRSAKRAGGPRDVDAASGTLWSRPQRAAVFDRARPVAILLLALALTDGALGAAEQAILVEVVDTAARQLGLRPDLASQASILEELLEIEPSGNLVTRATKSVLADTDWRDAMPRLIARMATADGEINPEKIAAIAWLRDTLLRVGDAGRD